MSKVHAEEVLKEYDYHTVYMFKNSYSKISQASYSAGSILNTAVHHSHEIETEDSPAAKDVDESNNIQQLEDASKALNEGEASEAQDELEGLGETV